MSEFTSETECGIDNKSDAAATLAEQDAELDMEDLDHVEGGFLMSAAFVFLAGYGAGSLYRRYF